MTNLPQEQDDALETQSPEESVPDEPVSSTTVQPEIQLNKRNDWWDTFTKKAPPQEEAVTDEPPVPIKPVIRTKVYGQEKEIEIPEGIQIAPGSKGEQWLRDELAAAGAFHEMPKEERLEYSRAIKENTEELRRQREAQEKQKQEPEQEYDFRDYLYPDQKTNYELKRKKYDDMGMDIELVDLEYQEKASENQRRFGMDKKYEEDQNQIRETNKSLAQRDNAIRELDALHRLDPEIFLNPHVDPQTAYDHAANGYFKFIVEEIIDMGGDPATAKVNHTKMVARYKILTGKNGNTQPVQKKGSSTPVPQPNGAGNRDFSKIADTVEGAGGNKGIGTPDAIDEKYLFSLPTRELKKVLDSNPRAREIYNSKLPPGFKI